MPQLLVRNVPESVAKKLKLRAAEKGISAEEEHRRILCTALEVPFTKPDFLAHLMSAPFLAEEDEWMFDRNDPRMKRPERPIITFED